MQNEKIDESQLNYEKNFERIYGSDNNPQT